MGLRMVVGVDSEGLGDMGDITDRGVRIAGTASEGRQWKSRSGSFFSMIMGERSARKKSLTL